MELMSVNNQNKMKFNLISELKAIKPGNLRDFICGIELELENNNNNDARLPVDIICLIDNSGSMAGKKAQLVRKSLKYLLKILEKGDQISLVSFSSTAKTLCPLTQVNDENKQQIKSAIKQINGQGGTFVIPGFKEVTKILNSRKEQREQTFILLLTDGEFGDIDSGKVIQNINRLFTQSEIQKTPYIYTYGYGDDVNPEILQEIAQKFQGKYCLISNVQQVTDWFLLSVSSFLKCSCKELSIKIKEVRKDLAYIKQTIGGEIIWRQQNYQTREFEIYIPLLIPGDKKCFVFQCSLDSGSQANNLNNKIIVLEAQINYQSIDNKGEKQTCTLNSNLAIQLLSDVEQQKQDMEIEQSNPEIITSLQEPYYENLIVTFYRGLGGKAIKESSDIIQSEQNYSKAKENLNSFKQTLNQVCKNFLDNKGIQHLLEDIEKALTGCDPRKYYRGHFQKMNAVHERRSRSNSHDEDWNQENKEAIRRYRNREIALSDSDRSISRSKSRSNSRNRYAKRAGSSLSRSKSRSISRSYSESLSRSYSKDSGSSESQTSDNKNNNNQHYQRNNRFRNNNNRSRLNQVSAKRSRSNSRSQQRSSSRNNRSYSPRKRSVSYSRQRRNYSPIRNRSQSPRRNNNQRQYSRKYNRNNFKSQYRRSVSRSRSDSRSRSYSRENNRRQRRIGYRRY
ncbi:Von willebrand factor type A (vWA) domain was originally protein (macronuclear) [Tetrahymena thermophila SB210]|uniref:von willebrand factor type A (VWA) domain was originally protein n=1 Tax=Tetrahymena thermophila (strain SB210) TaxID=312017 RepID=Q23FU3_TETTS|nr:Von willebrand factor type A (vWA) domain was originally protein [Tetrahymena thermophila SB210]EAR95517.2 Von willebrand factor type A (vWA) domain was originally protein [Tetrahymena thermophila SB210]|eukprot:XP_001015762.2 Von willebrand factor type A (vWA) domain was originally protein [Tetrahymena thermophila SB210]